MVLKYKTGFLWEVYAVYEVNLSILLVNIILVLFNYTSDIRVCLFVCYTLSFKYGEE